MSEQQAEAAQRLYAAIGELVLSAAALDHQLNSIVISLFSVEGGPMTFPLIAMIDSSRKIEVVRYRAKLLGERVPDWQKAFDTYLDKVGSVNGMRNTAAHSVLYFDRGKPFLTAVAGNKLLRAMSKAKKLTTDFRIKVPLSDLQTAITISREALGLGERLKERLQDFERAVRTPNL